MKALRSVWWHSNQSSELGQQLLLAPHSYEHGFSRTRLKAVYRQQKAVSSVHTAINRPASAVTAHSRELHEKTPDKGQWTQANQLEQDGAPSVGLPPNSWVLKVSGDVYPMVVDNSLRPATIISHACR